MYKGSRIGVVVPAFNEEAFVRQVVASLPAFVDVVIVVDDASIDRTSEEARSAGDPRVTVIRTPENRGVGGATLLGYAEALERGCDIVAKMDGDGQMAPDHLASLLDALIDEGYDYAKGNRFLSSRSLAGMPRQRVLANIVTTFLTKLASGYWHVFDPQNGYVAIKAAALRKLNFERIHRRYFFENDMLVELNLRSARVRDVGIPARYGDEVSDIGWSRVAVTFPWLLLRRFFRRLVVRYVVVDLSPVAVFLFSGLILFSWGVGFGAFIWIRTLITDVATMTGTIMLALVPLVLGFQLVLQGVVLDIQESQRLR
jgi:glycosyltransferase involved in cell wall biosynthesis